MNVTAAHVKMVELVSMESIPITAPVWLDIQVQTVNAVSITP